MRFYLASKFAFVEDLKKIVEILELRGHTITCKWWTFPDIKSMSVSDKEWWDLSITYSYMSRDLAGIDNCDIFVLVSKDTPQSFNGASLELGYALAKDKLCFIIGKIDRCAMYAGANMVNSIYDIIGRGKNEFPVYT